MDQLLKGKLQLDKINRLETSHKKLRFEDKYKRVTLYLENSLHDQINELRETGEIPNLTNFVNEAINSYLQNNNS